MKVKCICVAGNEKIKLGEVYEVDIENSTDYLFKINGLVCGYRKSLFEIVKEPKFKVGDKVIISDGVKWSRDKEYHTVKGYEEGEYKLNFSFAWKENELELYKEEETIMEKTFKEVIADIKEGEIWESKYKQIKLSVYGIIVTELLATTKTKGTVVFDKNTRYKLQRKKYSFTEAFAAYEKGKEIENIINGTKYRKGNREELIEVLFKDSLSWEEKVISKIGISIEAMQESWYINE